MNKNFKIFKLKKIKLKLKNYNLIFFFHTINLNTFNNLKIEQQLFMKNIKFYKAQNNSVKIALKNSIFLKFYILINGSLCFGYYNNEKLIHDDFKKSVNFNSTIILTALKLNKKLYSSNQLKNLLTLNYLKNITVFNKTLNKFIKKPYYTIKN